MEKLRLCRIRCQGGKWRAGGDVERAVGFAASGIRSRCGGGRPMHR